MKKVMRRLPIGDTNIDMTSMLDIVFILLIFFIVTTSFVKETGLTVKRPQTGVSEAVPGLNLQISESGELTLNNRQIELARLVANVQSFLAENTVDSMTINAHPKAKHGVIVKAMNQAKVAGIQSISLMVKS
ncbi:biopolymer transporter ExbD [Aliiglaciecola sp.]|nr:biopolymer transporter ExbD [Aliiglaciecola sp.]